jgi:hypothetical protein
MSIARVLGITVLLLSACSPPDDGSEHSSPLAAPAGSVYYTMRPDLRVCIWPFCGGVWIRAANSDQTQCADGSVANECYVAKLEAAMASQSALGDVTRLVVRGEIQPRTQPDQPPFFVLHADTVWEAGTSVGPRGTYWLASGHGGAYEITALNHGEMHNVHGIDLAPTGASPKQMESAIAALAAGRLVVAGTLETGPDGSPILRVSQFYLRVGSRFDNTYNAWMREVQK